MAVTAPPKPSQSAAGPNPAGGVVAACPLCDIVVHVREDTAGGTPLVGIGVKIDGPVSKSATTDASGDTTFSQVPEGSYKVSGRETDFQPDPAETSASPPCGGKQEVTLVLSKAFVVQIKARVSGTTGVRKGTKRAEHVLKSSTSDDETLSGNKPVILVRGCKTVRLEAITSPPGLPVSWEVKANENTDAPPTITPTDGGKKATLNTDVHGSMSVIATLGGKKVVWNVVFVWVQVDIASSAVTTRDNKYADGGSGGVTTSFVSGDFVAGKYTWEVKVDVKVLGGGNDKRLGTDKVRVHILQNGVTDTLTARYVAPGISAREVPKGGLPIVDSNDASSPWLFVAASVSVTPNNTGFKRAVWTGDSPTGSFPMLHQNSNTAIKSIDGVNGFRVALGSASTDAPRAMMAHAEMSWRADFSGTADAAGTYTPNGANTTSDAGFKLISAGTGGKDAGLAGFETFEPRFNGGTNTTWVP